MQVIERVDARKRTSAGAGREAGRETTRETKRGNLDEPFWLNGDDVAHVLFCGCHKLVVDHLSGVVEVRVVWHGGRGEREGLKEERGRGRQT